MDDEQSHNLQSIYTQIGMIMEDAAVIALKLGGSKGELDLTKVHELEQAVVEITALMGATHSVPD